MNWHTPVTLIRANLALASGERSEALRWVGEFHADDGSPDNLTMAAWIQAQAQADSEEWLAQLRALIANAPPGDPYAIMANSALHDDAERQAELAALGGGSRSGTRILGLPVLGAIAFFAVGAVLAGLSIVTLFGAPPQTDISQPTAQVGLVTPTQPVLPDRSRPLVPEAFTARYGRGILQITAIEDPSERVVDLRSGDLRLAVPGARLYALRAVFECRSGICNAPPEAEILLRLADGSVLRPLEDAAVFNESIFEPIALGRSTTGWLVFEVPLISGIETLEINPKPIEGLAEPTPERFAIQLSGI
jgi:hypothetical protein